jgi:hypothetical protein
MEHVHLFSKLSSCYVQVYGRSETANLRLVSLQVSEVNMEGGEKKKSLMSTQFQHCSVGTLVATLGCNELQVMFSGTDHIFHISALKFPAKKKTGKSRRLYIELQDNEH